MESTSQTACHRSRDECPRPLTTVRGSHNEDSHIEDRLLPCAGETAKTAYYRARLALVALFLVVLSLPGCQKRPAGDVHVIAVIGNNTGGRGPGEFIYPRAIDLTADGKI